MGLQIPITRYRDRIVLDIPQDYIPTVREVEIVKPVMIPANTYTYGGGGLVKVDNVIIPRTGIYGKIPIPINPKLTHFGKKGAKKLTYIKEEPILYPGYWRRGLWRANIPKNIRVKYRILPEMEVQLVYTERVPAWIVNITHLGKTYYARWYRRQGIVRWEILENVQYYDIIKNAIDGGMSPFGDLHIEKDMVYVDFVFTPNEGKRISRHNRIVYRNMTLRNYTATVELDYGFLAEIRATYLSCCPRNFYQSKQDFMSLMDALRITVENIVNFWFQFKGEGSHIRYAEKKGKVKYEVTGEEIQKRVSFGEVADFPFYKCDKYVRIVAHDNEYEYDDDRLTRDLSGKLLKDGAIIIVDGSGFIWLRR